jgi:hypothetical protein
VADSGVLDLFDVGLDGRLRRLTYTTSDDYWQDWAPDGTQLVFATTRWTRYGRLNLAVYDMATGGVRRLTQADTTSDSAPAWSPDGSRIAFTRARPGSDRSEVCVIDTDRGHERCRQPVSAPQTTVRGWADPHRVLLQGSRDGMATLVRADVDSGNGTAEQVIATGGTEFEASPDGQYALCNCARRGYPAGSWFLFGVDTPDDVKPIRLSEADRREADRRDVRISWAPTSPRRPYLDTLRVALGPGLPTLGTPYQLRTAGVDTAGKAVEFGAVRWRSLDTTVATVDSAGLLRARRAGRVTVEASAGGWRATRATLSVAAPTAARVLLDERWTRGLAPTWRPFGEPRPAIVESDRFGPAFLQNGDGSFASGAYTARAFDTRGALWVEAEQSVPLTTDGPSQEQALLLFAIADSARWARWDHRTGFPPTTQRCELYYPRGPVGPRARGDSLQLRVVVAGRQVAAPHAVQDGRPFRALVQLFPDGRCGFAFDGVPLWVSPPAYFDADTRVMLEGNSQETRVLVGPLRVVSGVAPHVDWRALDTAAASPQPPHGTPAPHRHAAP